MHAHAFFDVVPAIAVAAPAAALARRYPGEASRRGEPAADPALVEAAA